MNGIKHINMDYEKKHNKDIAMTAEKKAKAYDEALERARKSLRAAGDVGTNIVTFIFPQLTESEDERIIGAIIDALYSHTNSINLLSSRGYQMEDIEAWLEKQKEQNQECGEKGMKGPQEIGDWRGDEGMCKKQKEQTSDIILKAFENSKTDYSLEEREEASDYSEKVLPTSIALGESEEEYLLHKVIEAAYIAGQKEQPAQSFNQEQFFAKKDSTPFEKELFLSLRAIKETKPSDEEIWLNVKEQLTPVLLSLVQKEQKPELYYDKELDIAAREFYLSGGADSPVDSTGLVPIVRMAEFGATWMKERTQKEQKPVGCADDVVEEAEEYASKVACGEYGVEVTEAYIAGVLSERNRGTCWSEKDERMRNQLICDVEHHKKEGLISAKQNKATKALYSEIEKCYDEKIAWLKSLPERFNLQPKQEWSEEDVKRLYSIGTQIGFLKGKYSEYQKDIDWFHALAEKIGFHKCKTGEVVTEWKKEDIDDKMLSKPKQEWSEEDEEMLHGIEQCVYDNVANIGTMNKVKYIDFLSSLHPDSYKNCNSRWRPSEEQMKQLKSAADLPEFGPMVTTRKQFPDLESLYEQLKKL